jgi:hypothetical protein
VIRLVDRLGERFGTVVVDGVGSLQDLGGPPRGRFATAQAIAREADVFVAVCDASPVGLSRLLAWVVDSRSIAPSTPIVVAVNRAPAAAFRRGELYDEITSSLPAFEVVFVAHDSKVTDAAWAGRPVARGRFTRAVGNLARIAAALARAVPTPPLEVAS